MALIPIRRDTSGLRRTTQESNCSRLIPFSQADRASFYPPPELAQFNHIATCKLSIRALVLFFLPKIFKYKQICFCGHPCSAALAMRVDTEVQLELKKCSEAKIVVVHVSSRWRNFNLFFCLFPSNKFKISPRSIITNFYNQKPSRF